MSQAHPRDRYRSRSWRVLNRSVPAQINQSKSDVRTVHFKDLAPYVSENCEECECEELVIDSQNTPIC